MKSTAPHNFDGERSTEWKTPRQLFDQLDQEFGFTLDAAASSENTLCDRYFTIADDGLAQDWTGEVVWCNPPYGRHVDAWIRKASDSAATVVLLLFARTDTGWFHDLVMPRAAEVRLIRNRLYFAIDRRELRAPYPSMIIVFRPEHVGPPAFSTLGRIGPTQGALL